MGGSVNFLKSNMKLPVIIQIGVSFLVSIALAQDVVNEKAGNSIKVDTRAPSDYQNCNCQCDSYTWSDGNYIRGNCRSKAKLPGPSQATGLFCYISGSALCSCRDVQRSNSVVDSYGNLRYYSFEACTTPPRNRCQNYGWGSYGGGGNYGDGDFPYCSNSGSNQGSNGGWSGSNSGSPGWSGGSSSGSNGWSSGSNCRHSGCSNYRPSGGSSNYRPGGSTNYRPGGSSNYRPGGSSSNYRPSGSNNRPSLDNILNGNIRNGNTDDKDAVVFGDA